jgi:hypothetical protein
MTPHSLDAFEYFHKLGAIPASAARLLHERGSGDRSRVLFRFINESLRAKIAADVIVDAALDS